MTLLGLGRSHAVYRDGLGCHLDHGDADLAPVAAERNAPPALLPDIAGPAVVAPDKPAA